MFVIRPMHRVSQSKECRYKTPKLKRHNLMFSMILCIFDYPLNLSLEPVSFEEYLTVRFFLLYYLASLRKLDRIGESMQVVCMHAWKAIIVDQLARSIYALLLYAAYTSS